MAGADAAVLRWTNETDPGQAAPGDAERMRSVNLDQRVVRVMGHDGEWSHIRFGKQDFRVREERLLSIGTLPLEVGDAVDAGGLRCFVRDIVWHFRDKEPNFYLGCGQTRLSKRFRLSDLMPASHDS